MDFDLSETQKSMKTTVRDFSQRELAPKAAELDRTRQFPGDGVKKMADIGLYGIIIPSKFGGTDGDTISYLIACEEVSAACGSSGQVMAVHNGAASTIATLGSDAQKEKYLPPMVRGERLGAVAVNEPNAGVEQGAVETVAVANGDHYLVSGTKNFATNGDEAEIYVVMLKVGSKDAPLSAMVIEKGTPGFTFGKKEEKLGLCAVPNCELIFQDCKVPKENLLGAEGMGMMLLMGFAGRDMPAIGALSVGLAQAALEASLKYARERQTFGQPIIGHQLIGAMLSDMAIATQAARLLVYQAGHRRDTGQPGPPISFMAKAFATEMAVNVTSNAIQIHGGYGYTRDFPVERYFRDARAHTLHYGTSEGLRMNIPMFLG